MKIGAWWQGEKVDEKRPLDERQYYRSNMRSPYRCFFLLTDPNAHQLRQETFSLCEKTGCHDWVTVEEFQLAPPLANQCLTSWNRLATIHAFVVREIDPDPRAVVYRRALASLAVNVNGRPCFCRLDERILDDPKALHSEQCRDLRALLERPHPADLLSPLEIPS